jgi:hypothetical protein
LIKLLKRLDSFLERKWRETSAFLLYLADKKVEEEDIDWLNMQNNMVQEKNNINKLKNVTEEKKEKKIWKK